MTPSRFRLPATRWPLLWVAALFLLGCASVPRLAYNNAPMLAVWSVDDYVDLRDGQKVWVRERFDRLLAWHRKNELPLIQRTLSETHDRIGGAWTEAQVEAIYRALRASYERTVVHSLPDIAEFAGTVSADQKVNITRKLQTDNAKLDKDRAKPQRAQERVKRFVERIEDFTGPLTAAQRQEAENLIAAYPSIEGLWVADRKFRQQAWLTIMREGVPREEATAMAKRLLLQQQEWRDPAYLAALREREKLSFGMFARLLTTLTPEQQVSLKKRLKSFEGDILAVAKG
jgi:hypothetical protein